MTLGSISALLVLGVLLIEEARGCPDPMELATRVEKCMEPLSIPTQQTVEGLLRSTTWRAACRVYDESWKCVSDLEKQCQSQSHELEVTRSTLIVLKNGFGKICEDKKIRDRYIKYAPCYEEQADKTKECLGKFTRRVEEINTGSYLDMESYDDNPMCGAFQEMVRCVNKAVEDCGSDAASILDGLMRAQVPQQITAICQDSNPEPSPFPNNQHQDPSGSAKVLASATTLVFTIVIFLL